MQKNYFLTGQPGTFRGSIPKPAAFPLYRQQKAPNRLPQEGRFGAFLIRTPKRLRALYPFSAPTKTLRPRG